MGTRNYQRAFDQLKERASKFWPPELSQKEAELSIIPVLIQSQDDFISILRVNVRTLGDLFKVIDAASMPGNLFVKHLVVLSDFGGEPLNRMNANFNELFPKRRLDFVWREEYQTYRFTTLPASVLNNDKLGIGGKTLLQKQTLSDLHKDVIAILLFGAASLSDEASGFLKKCEIGNYLGEPKKLEKFIRERYIWVSRITGGSQAATLGDLAEEFVIRHLQENLDKKGVKVIPRGSLPDVTQTENNRPVLFDIVVNDHARKKHVAVEVSFQMTTNSTIERKAGQSQSRYAQINSSGYKIAYVIDGAGNFERPNAIRTICSYSDCTVGFSAKELNVLCEFIREYLET